ncbi:DsbA family protein [Priestia koreensis]|uniref:DsbA family protein n=1 Tax=Priestia koreensis TaxID=284581 RepID=UPI0009F8BE7F|nr:thioredoxin domain-containing protein [Priestia koreensis]
MAKSNKKSNNRPKQTTNVKTPSPNTKKGSKQSDTSSTTKMMFWTIGIIAACVLIFILVYNGMQNNNGKNEATPQKANFNYSNQPFEGKETAPVSIVEFGDYKCPICKQVNSQIVPKIKKDLVDTGKAKLYFMNYAFIREDSETAAKFAEGVYQELGNEKFWKFHNLLYEKQPEDTAYEQKEFFSDSFLAKTLATIATPDEVKKVQEAAKSEKVKNAFDEDMAYVQKLGIQGTPTFFVNGKPVSDLNDLNKMVEDAAKEKK